MPPRPSSIGEEIRQTRPFRSRSQEAAVAILRTADLVRRHFSDVIEPHGITLQQYNVLRILRGADGEPLATLEIADRLIERTPGITRLLYRLEEKELVVRHRSEEDRRRVICRITPEGLELLSRLDDAVDEADEASMSALDEEEIETLLELLSEIRRPLRQ